MRSFSPFLFPAAAAAPIRETRAGHPPRVLLYCTVRASAVPL